MSTGTKKAAVKKKDKETIKKQPLEKFSLKNTWNQKKDDVLALVGKWTHQKSVPKKLDADQKKK